MFSAVWRRRDFAGSLIGGIRETQVMLDVRAEHGIASDVEMIEIGEIETAYERMLKRREVPLRHRHGVAGGVSRLASSGSDC